MQHTSLLIIHNFCNLHCCYLFFIPFISISTKNKFMLNVKTKIVTAAIVSAFLLGTTTTSLFAATNDFLNIGESSNWEQFFDNIFKRRLQSELSGGEEIPGPGDPDGEGETRVKIKINQSELCVDLKVENIDQATAAHIHHAPAGSAGAVVISLPIPDEEGEAKGCISVHNNLLEAIKENPRDYYINVHNHPYPNGAIRGQLSG